ncbi:hypothetical protein M8C21_007417, partial [Ambrosia artemisiifolia]
RLLQIRSNLAINNRLHYNMKSSFLRTFNEQNLKCVYIKIEGLYFLEVVPSGSLVTDRKGFCNHQFPKVESSADFIMSNYQIIRELNKTIIVVVQLSPARSVHNEHCETFIIDLENSNVCKVIDSYMEGVWRSPRAKLHDYFKDIGTNIHRD